MCCNTWTSLISAVANPLNVCLQWVMLGTFRSENATAAKTSLKSEFAFSKSSSRLFLPTYFVKCRGNFLESNSHVQVQKFGRLFFSSSLKSWIRHFHVVVVQCWQRNVQKSVMHAQSCQFCLVNQLLFFLTFSLPSHLALRAEFVQESLVTQIHVVHSSSSYYTRSISLKMAFANCNC